MLTIYYFFGHFHACSIYSRVCPLRYSDYEAKIHCIRIWTWMWQDAHPSILNCSVTCSVHIFSTRSAGVDLFQTKTNENRISRNFHLGVNWDSIVYVTFQMPRYFMKFVIFCLYNVDPVQSSIHLFINRIDISCILILCIYMMCIQCCGWMGYPSVKI